MPAGSYCDGLVENGQCNGQSVTVCTRARFKEVFITTTGRRQRQRTCDCPRTFIRCISSGRRCTTQQHHYRTGTHHADDDSGQHRFICSRFVHISSPQAIALALSSSCIDQPNPVRTCLSLAALLLATDTRARVTQTPIHARCQLRIAQRCHPHSRHISTGKKAICTWICMALNLGRVSTRRRTTFATSISQVHTTARKLLERLLPTPPTIHTTKHISRLLIWLADN